MTDPPDEPTPRLDAADRLERVIDAQSATLERIDDKSSRIARLLGILLSVVLSSLSLSVQLTDVTVDSLSTPTKLAFLVGVGLLLFSLGASILTLLSSRFLIGLTGGTGDLLSRRRFDPAMDDHLRHVVGTYAYNIRHNRAIIEANARWFKYCLVFFLLGEGYLGVAAGLFLSSWTGWHNWTVIVVSVPVAVSLARVALSGRYLTMGLEIDDID